MIKKKVRSFMKELMKGARETAFKEYRKVYPELTDKQIQDKFFSKIEVDIKCFSNSADSNMV